MRVLAFLLIVLTAGEVYAASFTGAVVGVHDGNTITVLDANRKQYNIRLAGIAAPKLGQAFGNASKQNLSDLIYRKQVTVEWNKYDRSGCIVGKVNFVPTTCIAVACLDGSDAGYEQVATGSAWHYKKYAGDQSRNDRERYAVAESQARTAKRGLWADSQPVPPWEWRHNKK